MTKVNATLQAEAILGFEVIARKRPLEENKAKRFVIGSPRKNVAFWGESFECILRHLKALDLAGKLDELRARPDRAPPVIPSHAP